ncbi:MAG TPA: hypothetical protein VGB79_10210 [Allosphingosinicella sp.]|jgi:hypothetical protein
MWKPLPLFALALAAATANAQPVGPPAPEPRIRAALPAAGCERPATREEIVVCGERESDERYRLPLVRDRRFDPRGNVDSVSRERNRLLGGSSAPLGSCTTVGPNGMTGCHSQGVWQRREQRGR